MLQIDTLQNEKHRQNTKAKWAFRVDVNHDDRMNIIFSIHPLIHYLVLPLFNPI